MFTLNGLKAFHNWTHSTLDVLFDHLEAMPEALLSEELDGFGFASIRAQVVHLLLCELHWLGRLQGQDLLPRGDEPRNVADFRALKRRAAEATARYLAGLTDEGLSVEVAMLEPDGTSMGGTPAKVMHHVLTHAFHHKGQVVAMCRLLGHPAPETDLLV